jgi:vitamin B12 transporter
MNKFIKTSIALACIASSSVALSQDIEEVVVTAKNNQTLEDVLQTIHVFDLNDIEASQAQTIPALIDQIPGISFRDSGGRGSATGVFLRGASSSQTIVLIDGVRVGSATLGAAALNSYPIEAIERIEILKGPFSGVYGADAVGGVIQLFTKKGGEGMGSVRASVGSDSLEEFDVSFNAGDQRNSFHLSAHSEDSKGIDRTSILSGGNDDIDGFEETAFALGGKLSFGEFTTASINILAADSTVDFDNTFGTDPGLQTKTETLSTALSVNTQVNDNINWNVTLGTNEDQSVTNGAFPSDLSTNRDTLGSELVFALGGESVLTAGVDYYEEDIKSPSTTFPITNRDNKGAFAQFTTRSGAFGVAASLRFDDNSAYGTDTNSSVAVSYELNDGLNATVSYGTAFSAPSFNFLYFPFFGNPDILPEESESYEVKLDGNTGELSWYVAAYKSDFKNLFSFNPNTFLAANVGDAEIEGVEASLSTTLADWNVALAADILSATNKQTGVELDDRAEQTIALSASKNFGKLDFEFRAKSESGRFDRSGTELASYTLLDINASYRITETLSVFAKIDNLLDKDFTVNLINSTERYNTQGRQAKVSLRLNF